MTLPTIAIPYHSTYGHTQKVAQMVAAGVEDAGLMADAFSITESTENNWLALDTAAAIVFGCPTYMGSISAEYKQFMDASSQRWSAQMWKDKLAGGFTNSGAFSGDKLSSLIQLNLFAMQHSMIWVSTGMLAPTGLSEPTPDTINRLGSFLGVATFSTDDASDMTPPSGDLMTARLYGTRIANLTKSFTPH